MAAQWSSHVDPVAHVQAVAVDRQRLVLQGVGDHQRDQLLRELVGAEVVGAARDHGVQPVRVVRGAHQEVGARLGGRVGVVGLERACLGETALRAQAAVDLVGRDLQEARHLVLARGVQQHLGAEHVGPDERRRRPGAGCGPRGFRRRS